MNVINQIGNMPPFINSINAEHVDLLATKNDRAFLLKDDENLYSIMCLDEEIPESFCVNESQTKDNWCGVVFQFIFGDGDDNLYAFFPVT